MPDDTSRRPEERLAAVVRGHVQGVGFRRYVRGWARRLALGGWVQNQPDGSVRLIAEGDADALDRLTRLLWGGPPPADVTDVEIDRQPGRGEFSEFAVRPTRRVS